MRPSCLAPSSLSFSRLVPSSGPIARRKDGRLSTPSGTTFSRIARRETAVLANALCVRRVAPPLPLAGEGRGEGALKRVRVIQRLGEFAVILAVRRTADLLDRGQLIFGEVELAFDHIGFAEILAHLRIVGIKGDGLEIIGDPFVGAPELAGRIAAIVEGARRVRIVERVEHVDRFLEAVGLRQRIGVFGELPIGKNAAVSLQALVLLPVPDLSRDAGREVLLLNVGVTIKSAASSPSASARAAASRAAASGAAAPRAAASAARASAARASAAAPRAAAAPAPPSGAAASAAAASPSAATARREGRRGERQAENENPARHHSNEFLP